MQYIIVTFVEEYGIGARSKMIETNEDGSQAVKVIKMTAPYNFERIAAHEDSVMAQLKPFFDAGWNVATSTAIPSSSQLIMQYFLRKEAQ